MSQGVADCRVVLFLPREYDVVDGKGGCVDVDLDPCLLVAIGMLSVPVEPRGTFCRSRDAVGLLMLMQIFLEVAKNVSRHIYCSSAESQLWNFR